MQLQRLWRPLATFMTELVLAALVMASCRADQRSGTPERIGDSVAALDTSPKIGDFVLYAERSVTLGLYDVVTAGDVGVRTPAVSSFGTQLVVGDFVSVAPALNLLAPSTSLAFYAHVGGVQTGTLTESTGSTLFAEGPFPAAAMPPLPLALTVLGSGSDVTVDASQVLTLAPGNYGALSVAGTVVLSTGVYSFSSVTLEGGARLDADASSGLVDVRIQGTLAIGSCAIVGPTSGGDQAAAGKLLISVFGDDGPAGDPPAVSIGETSIVKALLTAPHGTLTIGDGVQATGAFAGFDIQVGPHADVTFQSGFAVGAPGQQGQQPLHGYYGPPPDPAIAPLAGVVPGPTVVALDIGLPAQTPAGLVDLPTFVQQVSDPTSPGYRTYMTQADFTQQYGAPAADYQAVIAWATAQGLTVDAQYPSNLLLRVSGTAAQIEQALFANLVYRLRTDARPFVTVDREPSIDLSVQILRITGLDDFVAPSPASLPIPPAPSVNASTGARLAYTSTDIRNAYLGVGSSCQLLEGAGQTIALLELATYTTDDVEGYDGAQSPPIDANNVVLITLSPKTAPQNPDGEVVTDIDAAQAMAPAANIRVYEDTDAIAILHAIANDTLVTTASSSFGFSADINGQQALDQMAARGVSFFQSSGDSGACEAPFDGRVLVNQTLVGGTQLSTNAFLPSGAYPNPYYLGEDMWSTGDGPGNTTTSGGIMDGTNPFCYPYPACSQPIPIPFYQSQVPMGPIVTGGNGGSTQFRNYPDVALLASNVEDFFQGSQSSTGGTSSASPMWAGLAALVNEAAAQNGVARLGFANPVLYDIGLTRGTANDLYATSFHDIADGYFNPCATTACIVYGTTSGTIPDLCGGTIDCDSCTNTTCPGQGCCTAKGPSSSGVCVPQTCAALHLTSGTSGDGCGGLIDCTTPCVPTTCAAQNATTGSIADHCGGTLDCNGCESSTCAGQGCCTAAQGVTSGVCVPQTCASLGASSGTFHDGCGGTLDCNAPCVRKTCAGLTGNPGPVPDGCGGTIDCNVCVRATCPAGATSTIPDGCGGKVNCGPCVPTTCTELGANSGTYPDGCGGTLSCNVCVRATCPAGATGTIPDGCGGTIDCGPFASDGGNGFPTVAGYDLTTGWGTPTCGLVTKLAGATATSTVTVFLSNFNFHTTGFNLFNHNPNYHTPNGAVNGVVTLTCQPTPAGANALSTAPFSPPPANLGCFDGWGFLASLTCSGATGDPGDFSVQASVTFSILNNCDPGDVATTSQFAISGIGPNGSVTDVNPLNVCEAGFNVGSVDPCDRQQLEANVTISNAVTLNL